MKSVPHVNIETGEIKGVKPNSSKYYHEEGHIVFNNNFPSFLFWKENLLWLWFFAITLAIKWTWAWYVSLYLIGSYLVMGMFEEYWANKYAIAMLQLQDYSKGLNKKKHSKKEDGENS